MAKKDKAQGTGLDPCTSCNGTECGTPRVAVCCESCSH
jgi:hypothetical protein